MSALTYSMPKVEEASDGKHACFSCFGVTARALNHFP